MTKNKTILRALAGETLPVPPIWMMRQAGRYLPEYKATRAQAGDFLSLCYNPELAAEVTLQPIRRYGFDAAILFADILLVPQALGADLWFVTGEGPRLSTITTQAELEALKPVDAIHDTLTRFTRPSSILSNATARRNHADRFRRRAVDRGDLYDRGQGHAGSRACPCAEGRKPPRVRGADGADHAGHDRIPVDSRSKPGPRWSSCSTAGPDHCKALISTDYSTSRCSRSSAR